MQPRKNLAARIGGWSVHHRWTALGLWFAFVIIAVVGGAMAGEIDLKDSQTGNGESGHASQVIDKAGFKESANEMVLITSPTTTVKTEAFGATIDDVVATLEKDNKVQKVVDPREPGVDGKIADGGHAALVTFEVKGDETQADTNVVPVMDSVKALSADHPGFSVEQFGEASAAHVLNDKIGKDFEHARTVSLPLTLIILLFAFGAMVAAGVPVLLAFSAVLATFGLNSLFSHVMPSTEISAEIILMIGMAVGVDYSLFYLRRERDERAATKTYRPGCDQAGQGRRQGSQEGRRRRRRPGREGRAEDRKGHLAHQPRAGTRGRRVDVGTGRPDLGHHGVHRHVRHAAGRRSHLHDARHLGHDRRPRRPDRIADGPARHPVRAG